MPLINTVHLARSRGRYQIVKRQHLWWVVTPEGLLRPTASWTVAVLVVQDIIAAATAHVLQVA